jgi:hypothetical protein
LFNEDEHLYVGSVLLVVSAKKYRSSEGIEWKIELAMTVDDSHFEKESVYNLWIRAWGKTLLSSGDSHYDSLQG